MTYREEEQGIDHRRRYGCQLDGLAPGKRELRRYYERFNEETLPRAGEGMLAAVEAIKAGVAAARPGTVGVLDMLT